MALRNIEEFKAALAKKQETQDKTDNIELLTTEERKNELIKLIRKMEELSDIAKDIMDTYNEIEKINIIYAAKLLQYLQGNGNRVIMTPFFSFCPNIDDELYDLTLFLTTEGAVIYTNPMTGEPTDDWDEKQWAGNNAAGFIMNNEISDKWIIKLINSAKTIIKEFPKLSELFFDMVKYPSI